MFPPAPELASLEELLASAEEAFVTAVLLLVVALLLEAPLPPAAAPPSRKRVPSPHAASDAAAKVTIPNPANHFHSEVMAPLYHGLAAIPSFAVGGPAGAAGAQQHFVRAQQLPAAGCLLQLQPHLFAG